jgi:hypothetical protein
MRQRPLARFLTEHDITAIHDTNGNLTRTPVVREIRKRMRFKQCCQLSSANRSTAVLLVAFLWSEAGRNLVT